MKYLRILHKAQLTDDLFEGDSGSAGNFAPGYDSDWGEAAAVEAAEPFAVSERMALAKTDEDPFAGASVQPYGQRRWSEVLADLTGDPSLEACRTIGVCAADSSTPSSDVVAAVSRWMAQFGESAPLLVETRLRTPRLASVFGVPNRGIAEVLLGHSAADHMAVEVDRGRIHLLPAGELRRKRSIKQVLDGYPALHASLAERYASVLLSLPAADSSDFGRLPVGELCGAVILVVDSRAARRRKVEAASRRIRATGARLAAVLLSVPQTVEGESRRDLQMRWREARA